MKITVLSPAEIKLLKVLGRKKMTITSLAKAYYKGSKLPLSPNNTVAGVVRRINRKADFHKLDFYIDGTGNGRAGKVVWADKR